MMNTTAKFGDLNIGDHFWLDGQEYIRRELRGWPPELYNACAPGEGKPWAWIGDQVEVLRANTTGEIYQENRP